MGVSIVTSDDGAYHGACSTLSKFCDGAPKGAYLDFVTEGDFSFTDATGAGYVAVAPLYGTREEDIKKHDKVWAVPDKLFQDHGYFLEAYTKDDLKIMSTSPGAAKTTEQVNANVSLDAGKHTGITTLAVLD